MQQLTGGGQSLLLDWRVVAHFYRSAKTQPFPTAFR